MGSFLKRFFLITISVSLLILAYIAWSGYQFFQADNTPITQESLEETQGFQFVVLSDNEGATPIFDRLLQEISGESAQFLMHLGDLSPRGAESDLQEVRARLDQLPFPYYTAIGNNDLGRDRSRELYIKYFANARPENAKGGATYYSFDYQDAHFVVLDNSDRRVGFEDAQLAWLEKDLAEHEANAIFLFMHRPVDLPFTAFTGDDETPASRIANAKFIDIIEQHPITRIFAGHIHTLFTYTLGTTPVSVSGGGGAAPQDLIKDFVGPVYHYLLVTVTDEKISIEVKRLQE
ncbi:MAG: metallophosphoesterase [Candidatus Nomurabacteria bacterium]|nr:MAG: metallophosphoesterase [Candidatus Nomurabacteria bacterium]